METQDEAQEVAAVGSAGTGLKKEISGKQLLALVLVAGIGGLLYWFGPGMLESWKRQSMVRKDQPVQEWKGVKFGISRNDVAQLLVDNQVTWQSVPPPGAQVTEWAAHINTSINGNPGKEFAFRFADNMRWDYGQHPPASAEVVDVKTLVGGLDGSSKLTGIMWTIERSDYDLANETVPVEVLEILGASHEVHRDITGASNNYIWKWPGMECYYSTIDSNLRLLKTGEPSE